MPTECTVCISPQARLGIALFLVIGLLASGAGNESRLNRGEAFKNTVPLPPTRTGPTHLVYEELSADWVPRAQSSALLSAATFKSSSANNVDTTARGDVIAAADFNGTIGGHNTRTTALVFRGHKLTYAMRLRIIAAAAACRNTTVPIWVWVSIDTTSMVTHNLTCHLHLTPYSMFDRNLTSVSSAAYLSTGATGERDRLMSHLKNDSRGLKIGVDLDIHTYDSAEMDRRYPSLATAKARSYKPWRAKSNAFGYHTEAIMLWYNQAKVKRQAPAFVWVAEADAAYSGSDIKRFLNEYSNNPADFITQRCNAVNHGWWHLRSHSDQWPKEVRGRGQSWGVEILQRFSAKLLSTIGEWCDRGAHAWSEQVACTITAVINGTYDEIKQHHIGSPFSFKKGRQVKDAAQFSRIESNPQRQNKWHHAAKF